MPVFSEDAISTGRIVKWDGRIPPILLMEFTVANGKHICLCDFGSAGEGGTPYYSWLPFKKDLPNLLQFFG